MAKKRIRGRNEGTLYQLSNGSWRAQISLNGERQGCRAKTKAEAQKWLQKMLYQTGQGLDAVGSTITLAEYMEQWLESMQLSLRQTTLQNYRQTNYKHLLPTLGSAKLRDLNPIQIERMILNMVEAGRGVYTVRLTHRVLHTALQKAVQLRLLNANPASGVTLPRKRDPEMQILGIDQVSLFLGIASSSPYESLYYLAITTGMRQAELFGLKWADLNWNSGTLYVRRQVQRVPRMGWQFVEPKTRQGRRTLKLGEEILHRLRLHKEKQALMVALAGDRWQTNDLIFPNTVGNPGDASNLRKDFHRVLMDAGLPIIRFHDLRHTAASLMLNHGVPVIVASRRLGHAKASTTLDIYGHLLHEMQDEAARLMDQLVTPQAVNLETFNPARAPTTGY